MAVSNLFALCCHGLIFTENGYLVLIIPISNSAFVSEKSLISLLHYRRWDNVMQLCSEVEKQLFFHLIKDEEAKIVKAWELGGGGGRCCFFGNRPKTSVSVCSDDIIILLSHISDTLLSSALLLIFYWPNTESVIGLKFHCMLQSSNLGVSEFWFRM